MFKSKIFHDLAERLMHTLYVSPQLSEFDRLILLLITVADQ